MLYEFISNIQWLLWFNRILCSVSFAVFAGVVIWIVPLFLQWILRISGAYPLMRQNIVMIFRLILATISLFIIADILGFTSGAVGTTFVAVFGLGLSLAIRDFIANTVACIQFMILQSYAVGDEIEIGNSKGAIISFHMQYILVCDIERSYYNTSDQEARPYITMIPNQKLWTDVVRIEYQKYTIEDIRRVNNLPYFVSP